MRIYKFSKSAILHRVRKGPVKLLELAQGSRNPGVRKRLMRHINALEQAGTKQRTTTACACCARTAGPLTAAWLGHRMLTRSAALSGAWMARP